MLKVDLTPIIRAFGLNHDIVEKSIRQYPGCELNLQDDHLVLRGDKTQCRRALEHIIGIIVTKGVKKIVLLLIDNGEGVYRLDDLCRVNIKLQLALNAIFILIALFSVTLFLMAFHGASPYLFITAVLLPVALPVLHIYTLGFVSKPLRASNAKVHKFVLEYDDESRLYKALEILERLNGVKSANAIREFLLTMCVNEEFKPLSYYEEIVDLRRLRQRLRVRWGVYLIRDDGYEAFGICLPWLTRILVSCKLLAALEEEELGAVLAHEARHIANRDSLKALALIILFQLLNLTLALAGMIDLTSLFAIASLEAFTIVRLMRLWEFKADEYAASMTSSNSLIRALVKTCWKELVDEFTCELILRVKSAFSVHPPVYERIRRAYTYRYARVMSNNAYAI